MHADLANPEYRRWCAFLQRADHWSVGQIASYQLAETRRIIHHAYENTVGYHRKFENSGIAPDTIRTLEDIRRLPFTTKEEIRDALDEFSTGVSEKTYVTTGGSTGIPFGFYRTPEAFSRELASKAHQYHRIGWNEGDRQLVFRGLPIENKDHITYVPEFEELRCSSYHLMGEWLDTFYEAACEYRPEWIRCYPSSGFLFAKYLQENQKRLPPIKGVLCASENLYDFQRELLKQVFDARVFSHYGHYELSVLAGYCEHEDTYHVLPQYGLAELVDRDGGAIDQPGKIGEIVATSFLMYGTPFIRYRTGDFAVLKGWRCASCGRPYQIWERIEGRLQEFVITGTGRSISMTAINMHDGVFDSFRQFQFHQSERGKVSLHYIPKERCSESVLTRVHCQLMKKLGEDMELNLIAVEAIPLTRRGKHRFLIQELSLSHHDLGETPAWNDGVVL